MENQQALELFIKLNSESDEMILNVEETIIEVKYLNEEHLLVLWYDIDEDRYAWSTYYIEWKGFSGAPDSDFFDDEDEAREAFSKA